MARSYSTDREMKTFFRKFDNISDPRYSFFFVMEVQEVFIEEIDRFMFIMFYNYETVQKIWNVRLD